MVKLISISFIICLIGSTPYNAVAGSARDALDTKNNIKAAKPLAKKITKKQSDGLNIQLKKLNKTNRYEAMLWLLAESHKGNKNAFFWYKKQAELGDVSAQFQIGMMYEKGIGVPVDYLQAMQWYQKAATQGNTNAQIHLAILYAQGVKPTPLNINYKNNKPIVYLNKEEPESIENNIFPIKNNTNKPKINKPIVRKPKINKPIVRKPKINKPIIRKPKVSTQTEHNIKTETIKNSSQYNKVDSNSENIKVQN